MRLHNRQRLRRVRVVLRGCQRGLQVRGVRRRAARLLPRLRHAGRVGARRHADTGVRIPATTGHAVTAAPTCDVHIPATSTGHAVPASTGVPNTRHPIFPAATADHAVPSPTSHILHIAAAPMGPHRTDIHSTAPDRAELRERDFLNVDAPIRGQAYACLSIICPENVLKQKAPFFFNSYLTKFSTDLQLLFETLTAKYPDDRAWIDNMVESHAALFSEPELQDAFKMYARINQTPRGRRPNEHQRGARSLPVFQVLPGARTSGSAGAWPCRRCPRCP